MHVRFVQIFFGTLEKVQKVVFLHHSHGHDSKLGRIVLKQGNVNVTLFTENEMAPETLKNCDVQNAENWSCETIEVFQEQSHSMAKGLYFSKKIFRMLDGEDDVSVYCARE